MGLTLNFKEQNFEPLAEGVHLAVCDRIIDLGRQQGSEQFGGKIQHKVYIGWLVTDEVDENLNPKEKHIGRMYTLSTDKKSNLRKDLEAWRGKPFSAEETPVFDMDGLLGKGCQLQISHVTKDGKTRDQISGIMSLAKGMSVEPPAETLSFELTADTWDKLPEWIPGWLKNIIREGETWKELSGEQPAVAADVFGPDAEDEDRIF